MPYILIQGLNQKERSGGVDAVILHIHTLADTGHM